jgi:GPH family glycoside/pentoside/hexuronide:cation symporter
MSTFFGIGIINILIQPILGYLSDRNYTFTRKFGRRFPWILISGLITPIFVILLFSSQMIVGIDLGFFLIITLILYYVASSLYSLNYSASLLAKFHNPKERLIISTIIEFFSFIAYFLSILFIPIFIAYPSSSSFLVAVVTISIPFIITVLLGIPGLLEEKQLIDTYYSPNLEPQVSFFKDFFNRFTIFGRKNFIILLIQWVALTIFNYLFFNQLYYYIVYVLGVSYEFTILYEIIYFIMVILAIPFGFLISWFAGYVTTWIISGFILGASNFIFFFVRNPIISLPIIATVGFAIGLGIVALIPLAGDVFDENAVHQRKRSEGFNYGLLTLFGSGITFFIPSIIAMVLQLTGFEAGWPTVTELAILGIRVMFSVIPSIIIITSTILFLFLYDLKPEKTISIQEELKTLQI